MKKFAFLFSLGIATLFGETTQTDPVKGKVVLIHGFMNHNSMSSFDFLLKKTNWDVENHKYSSRDKSIEDHASDLVSKLNTLAKEDQPINFIAFSLGSLVLQSALNHKDLSPELKFGRIVLIAPPLNGSKIARFLGKAALVKKVFGNHSGKQLRETPFGGFDYLGPYPENIPILIISGTFGFNPLFSGINDGKVSIEETNLKTPHERKYVFAGHSWICKNLATINYAADFLDPSDEEV